MLAGSSSCLGSARGPLTTFLCVADKQDKSARAAAVATKEQVADCADVGGKCIEASSVLLASRTSLPGMQLWLLKNLNKLQIALVPSGKHTKASSVLL